MSISTKNNYHKIFIIASTFLAYINSYETNAQVLTNPVVEKIAENFNFIEGPVWVEGVGLLFSDIPANKIYLFDLDSIISVYKSPSGNSNGLALDAESNLIIAQHGPRQVSRMEENGDITPLAAYYEGKRLNSPNDLTLSSDNSIFFTDPPYGLNDQGGTSELGFSGIYRLMPSGKIYLLDNSLGHPNGIELTPDETKLYVGDSEARKIFIWDIINDSTLANKQQFAYMSPAGYTDGMKVDSAGYLYSAGPLGIWIYAPDGSCLDTILVPGQTSNCAWGDSDGNSLYVTSGNSLYRIRNKKTSPPVSSLNKTDDYGTAKNLIICPNPVSANATVTFKVSNTGRVRLSVINSMGQIVSMLAEGNYLKGECTFEWKTSNLENGIYYVVFASDNTLVTSKCIISEKN